MQRFMRKLGPYYLYMCPGVVRRMGEPAFGLIFARLNIENNYSNDDNEDLMTFTSRSCAAAGESQFK